MLATAGDDGTVKVWSLETGVQRLSFPAPGEVSDLDYSPDGRYLAAIGEGFVTVYILDVDELLSEAETRLDGGPRRNASSISTRRPALRLPSISATDRG